MSFNGEDMILHIITINYKLLYLVVTLSYCHNTSKPPQRNVKTYYSSVSIGRSGSQIMQRVYMELVYGLLCSHTQISETVRTVAIRHEW